MVMTRESTKWAPSPGDDRPHEARGWSPFVTGAKSTGPVPAEALVTQAISAGTEECHACDRDFLFFELRNVDTRTADRCPNCAQLLGVRGLLAVRTEQALAVLIGSLEDLARHHPNFTVRAGSVLRPVEEAVSALTGPSVDELQSPPLRPWWKRLGAAA